MNDIKLASMALVSLAVALVMVGVQAYAWALFFVIVTAVMFYMALRNGE